VQSAAASDAPSSRHILAIANQKGGVGKTTTAVNLGAALAQRGERVLVVDLDPQGNASTGLGIQGSRTPGSYALMLRSAAPSAALRSTALPSLRLLPADPDLAGAEIELVGVPGRERLLRDALAEADFAGFGRVLIDCPPSLGLLTLNAFVAADAVLVPLQCEFFALEGLSHLVRTIERVRISLNPAIALEGILLTMLDRRNNLSDLVAADARSFFGAKVYDTVIPRNVRVSEAPSHGMPVVSYDPRSAGALAYGQLAAEIQARGSAPAPQQGPSPLEAQTESGARGFRGVETQSPSP
jgi:chromosome partitioning protein